MTAVSNASEGHEIHQSTRNLMEKLDIEARKNPNRIGRIFRNIRIQYDMERAEAENAAEKRPTDQ